MADEHEKPGELTHLDAAGHARMVDVGSKAETERMARASGLVRMLPATLDRVIAFEKRLALYESEPWKADAFFLLSSRVRRNAPSLYAEEASYPLTF